MIKKYNTKQRGFLALLASLTSLRNPKKFRTFEPFERKVLLSIYTAEKFLNATFFHQIVLQNLQCKNLQFSETVMANGHTKQFHACEQIQFAQTFKVTLLPP